MEMEEESGHNQKGILTRIQLTNFMAYEEIEFFPGPYLNILLGANGTGKSSIVCAIVLGLGGKPKTIGRTAQLKDYVNNNSGMKAKIIIELFNPNGENYVVQREFNRENKNSWHLNGKSVSQKEIDELMKTLNIQVDNLCQFLPQDKVQDFAKMNVQQLLENTVKTVGSTDMIDWHTSLVNMRKDEGEVQKILAAKTGDLERERHKLAGLENEAQFVKQRNEILQSMESITQKKAWTVYGEANEEVKEITAEREILFKQKCEAENIIKPFELEVKKAKDVFHSADVELDQVMGKIGSSLNAVHKKMNEMNSLEENIARIKRELQAALQSVKNKEQDINKLIHSISVFESTGLDPAKEQELETKARELQQKLNIQSSDINLLLGNEDNLKHEMKAIENNLRRNEMRLNSANDVANEKYNIFQRRNPGAYELMMWLKDNRGMFRGYVYNPIQLEINVKPEFARFVEHAIPFRDLDAFLCEYNEDVSTLLRIARIEKNLRINAISVEHSSNVKYRSITDLKNLSAYGFHCYVVDNIEGPRPIINYLCKTYNLHNIPIGNDVTETMLNSIPQSVTKFFTGENHHSICTSKYSGAKISRVTRVANQVRVLINSLDMELVKELNKTQELELQKLNESQNELRQIRIQLNTAEQAREKLKNEKKDVLTKLNELRSARTNVTMKKEELRILRMSMVDPETQKEKAKQETLNVVKQIVALQKSIQEGIGEYQEILLKSKFCQLKQRWADDVIKVKERKLAEHMSDYEDAKRDLHNKDNELANAKQDLKKAYEAARHATEGLTPKDKAFKDRFQNKFKEFPDSVDELQASIERVKAQIACMGEGRLNVIEEYEKQVKRVKTLETELSAPEMNLQFIKAKMEVVKVKWLTSVTNLISQINEKYTMFFARMHCVGEVDLYKPPVEENYQEYGIVIKVKFRNDDRLKELGPCQQSGGERAVSTAVYMLALQHLTTVPFRCVDEINQGMDEKNERVVYKLLMETTEEAAAAQCFLLTPKLLLNLTYTDKTMISCVIKGNVVPFMSNIKSCPEITRQQKVRTSRKRKHSREDSNDSSFSSSGLYRSTICNEHFVKY